MNTLHTFCLGLLFSGACLMTSCESSNGGESNQVESKPSNTLVEKPEVPPEVATEAQPDEQKESLEVKAKFVSFEFGDAAHYYFEDEAGKGHGFDGCKGDDCNFVYDLPEEEIDDINQGYGPNPDLLGKWFEITYHEEEQPLYPDGPIGTVKIITAANQVD